MLSKLRTLLWFMMRPSFYMAMLDLMFRNILPNQDTQQHKDQARAWCESKAVTIEEINKKYQLAKAYYDDYKTDAHHQQAITAKIQSSSSNFGGEGYSSFLYALCETYKVKTALETGVAYGWSSYALLKSLTKQSDGQLVSVDMPMVKQNDYHLIGIAVKTPIRSIGTYLESQINLGCVLPLKN